MNQAIEFLAAPFLMCLILVGIHCYLGLHVLARGVIFVDLSLAQIASLGSTLALIWDPDHTSKTGYLVSLGLTLVTAGLFAAARKYEKHFSQEAVIGVVYALASAMIVLVVDRLAHGAEHLRDALIGKILWVTWEDFFKTVAIYTVVGLIHFVLRGPILSSSFAKSPAHWIWDFVFYGLFGVVITSSTHVAGVLLVFSFLIVPALVSTVFVKTVKARLIFGWSLGAVLSFVGLAVSYYYDLPAGALLVVLFTVLPLLLLLLLPFKKKS